MKPRAAVSWSGGKDSYLALHRSRSSYDIVALITMFDEEGTRSRSHGLRPQILEAQADRLGLPICKGRGSWMTYEDGYMRALSDAGLFSQAELLELVGDVRHELSEEQAVREAEETPRIAAAG